jgi:uncharacterized protein (DUF488 family)
MEMLQNVAFFIVERLEQKLKIWDLGRIAEEGHRRCQKIFRAPFERTLSHAQFELQEPQEFKLYIIKGAVFS